MSATATMKRITTKFLGGAAPPPSERTNQIDKLKVDLRGKAEELAKLDSEYEALLADGAAEQAIESKEVAISACKTVIGRLEKQIKIAELQHEAANKDEKASRENDRQAKVKKKWRELRDELLKSHLKALELQAVLRNIKDLSQHLDEENAFFRAAGRQDLVLSSPLNQLRRHLDSSKGPQAFATGYSNVIDPVKEFKLKDYWPDWPDRTAEQRLGRIGEIEV